jgi:hypothetical protein
MLFASDRKGIWVLRRPSEICLINCLLDDFIGTIL